MRVLLVATILGLLVPCTGCKGGAGSGKLPDSDQKTRLVLNDYRGLASVFVMENLAGRDLVELRSKPLPANRPAVAYVKDDVMATLLKQLRRNGFFRYRQTRPPDPLKFGARGEFTMIDEGGARTSLLKMPVAVGSEGEKQQIAMLKSFVACKASFLSVYNKNRPQMQARVTRGASDPNDPFGVRRADHGGSTGR